MVACEKKYLHEPSYPKEMEFWPFNVPVIMTMLEQRGLEVKHLYNIQAEIDDLFAVRSPLRS